MKFKAIADRCRHVHAVIRSIYSICVGVNERFQLANWILGKISVKHKANYAADAWFTLCEPLNWQSINLLHIKITRSGQRIGGDRRGDFWVINWIYDVFGSKSTELS